MTTRKNSKASALLSHAIARGMHVPTFAEAFGVSPAAVYAWAAGARPGSETMWLLESRIRSLAPLGLPLIRMQDWFMEEP